jgi:hypothetical protein
MKNCAQSVHGLTIFYPTYIPDPGKREERPESFQYFLKGVRGGSQTRPTFNEYPP